MFNWVQQSSSAPNESFVVGEHGGDTQDALLGSPSGVLLAGHTYRLASQFFIQANRTLESGATAVGDLHFNITPDLVSVIHDLIDDVLLLNLQNGIANNLDGKLDAVVRVLEDVNENNNEAACGALGAFISAVCAQRRNHILVEDADTLVAAAQDIRELLDCGEQLGCE